MNYQLYPLFTSSQSSTPRLERELLLLILATFLSFCHLLLTMYKSTSPLGAKRTNTQATDGPVTKKQRMANKKSPLEAVGHIVELLPHPKLRDVVFDLLKDSAISTLVMNHLKDRERAATQATYDSLITALEDFEIEIRGVKYGGEIWGTGGLEVPEFWDDIDLLRKAGRYGHELAWQAFLRIADNYKHNGEQGYMERDGPDRFEDDDFHWDVDSTMLECCVELEAQAPEDFNTTDRIRDLRKLRRKVGSDSGYRYLLTLNYLKWIRGGKIGNYKGPDDYKPKPKPKPEPAPETKAKQNSISRPSVRTKQAARKSAPSNMTGSNYMLAFAGQEEGDDEGTETFSSDNEKNPRPTPHPLPRARRKQTARKRAPSYITGSKYVFAFGG